MQYLNETETRRFFTVAYNRNRAHHLALLMGYIHALRASEIGRIIGSDIQDGWLSVQRLKGSNKTLQPIHVDVDPIFDCGAVLAMAASNPNGRLFPMCRQRLFQICKTYGELAGLHPDKAHPHSITKSSMGMYLWNKTHSLGQIQNYLGHKSASSTLCYLREVDASLAQAVVAKTFEMEGTT